MNSSLLAQPEDQIHPVHHSPTNNTPIPSLVIDMRKSRIRIHKQTLHILGDPDYVQLLVNPTAQTIAIRCSTSKDHLAHRIHWKTIGGKQCCEIYSKYLMAAFSEVFLYLHPDKNYRITGKLYEKNKLAHFDLKDSVCISQSDKYEENNT